MLVKIPVGTLVLLSLAGAMAVMNVMGRVVRAKSQTMLTESAGAPGSLDSPSTTGRGPMRPRLLDELFLLAPAIVVIFFGELSNRIQSLSALRAPRVSIPVCLRGADRLAAAIAHTLDSLCARVAGAGHHRQQLERLSAQLIVLQRTIWRFHQWLEASGLQ